MIERLQILLGDCRETLKTLPDESVQCCVSSPPYWGLRDYGTAEWAGGSDACSHEPTQEWIDKNFNANSGFGNGAKTQSAAAKTRWYKSDGSCPSCGACRTDSQIGLEQSPESYVSEMVSVFREVRRVMRKDGALWLNLGDSYASDIKGSGGPDSSSTLVGTKAENNGQRMKPFRCYHGLKPKDLIGIPWMVAFALRADGWWLRQEIIWAKPNPMPESVTDRCTKSHEHIFLLSKSPKYYFDSRAIAEPATSTDETERDRDGTRLNNTPGRTRMGGLKTNHYKTRNKRSVWNISTKPYKGAHFATFPPDLIEPCILAGCPKGGVVLDPFGGSGTTAQVAITHGRRVILCELNPEYIQLIHERCDPLLVPKFETPDLFEAVKLEEEVDAPIIEPSFYDLFLT